MRVPVILSLIDQLIQKKFTPIIKVIFIFTALPILIPLLIPPNFYPTFCLCKAGGKKNLLISFPLQLPPYVNFTPAIISHNEILADLIGERKNLLREGPLFDAGN